MICIRPIAPLGEIARTSPKLSACMTARIHAAGMPKRREASATTASNRVATATRVMGRPGADWAQAGMQGADTPADKQTAMNGILRIRAKDGSERRRAGKEKGARKGRRAQMMTGERRRGMSIVLLRPEGIGAADDRGAGEQPEIAAVEGVFGLPVHQEDLALGDALASMPDRKRPTAGIALESLPHRNAIDRDRALIPADHLPRKRKHAFQHRHTLGEIAPISEELCECVRRPDDDQLGDMENAGRPNGVKPDRDTLAGVPNELGRDGEDCGAARN